MDENSCENETKESVDDKKEKKNKDPQLHEIGATLALTEKVSKHHVAKSYERSLDAAGPSKNIYPLILYKDNTASGTERPLVVREPEKQEIPREVPSDPVQVNVNTTQETQTITRSEICEPRVRTSQTQEQPPTKRGSVGPPPSYSFVMKQKKKLKHVPSPDPLITNRPPPPNYAGSRGLYMTSEERTCGFPSFAEPIWRSHSQPALCPRCGIIVLTTTHSHESIATHVAALALCLFGCWPCCLLPYCMNVCKNTYHYCPICQAFLGLYTPW